MILANGLTDLLDWFAGGSHPYMTLYHCMNHDHLWIAITVLLDVVVVSTPNQGSRFSIMLNGFAIIATHHEHASRDAVAVVE